MQRSPSRISLIGKPDPWFDSIGSGTRLVGDDPPADRLPTESEKWKTVTGHGPRLPMRRAEEILDGAVSARNTLYETAPAEIQRQIDGAIEGTAPASGGGGGSNKPPAPPDAPAAPDAPGSNSVGDSGRKPPKIPMAGIKLAQFMTSPLGEEVLEGVLGGTMVVAPQFFSEEDPRENALQLALAIGGGIGVGMAGRRIGADLGKRIHPDEIKNEAIATMARFGGEERMSQGLANGMTQLSAMNSFGKLKDANHRLRMDLGTLDDAAFSKSYPELASKGVLPSTVSKEQLDVLDNLTAESSRVARRMVEDSAEEQANFTSNLKIDLQKAAADQTGSTSKETQELARMIDGQLDPEAIKGMILGKQKPITGEHVGRMLGRVLGDEIGILGGAGVGALLASQLGWQSPKDKQIESLQKQLAQA